MDRGCGFGSSNCRNLPTKPAAAGSDCHFPAGHRPSGTRSSIGSSPSSLRIGVASRCAITKTIVHLIAKTTTAKGLKVAVRLDRRKYPTGRKITDEEMKIVNVKRGKFHGEWNYIISPHT